MPRRAAAELAELPDLVHAERVAGQMQQPIQQHRSVAVGQDETVAIPPARIGGIVLKEVVPEHLGNVCHAHRGARMSGIGLLHGIHRQGPDGVG